MSSMVIARRTIQEVFQQLDSLCKLLKICEYHPGALPMGRITVPARERQQPRGSVHISRGSADKQQPHWSQAPLRLIYCPSRKVNFHSQYLVRYFSSALQCVQRLGKNTAVNEGTAEIKLTAPGAVNSQHSVSPHWALPDSSKPS